MNVNGLFVASLFLFRLTGAFSQDYGIEADTQEPYAFNEARIISRQGFGKPVFLFAEFMTGNDALVFRTEKTGYAKDINARYYSRGSVLALSLYPDLKKTSLLARLELRQAGALTHEKNKIMQNLTVNSPPGSDSRFQFKPARYSMLLLPVITVFILALSRKKKQNRPISITASAIILFASTAAAISMILFYSEKPSLEEVNPGKKIDGYSLLIIRSSASEGYRWLLFRSSHRSFLIKYP